MVLTAFRYPGLGGAPVRCLRPGHINFEKRWIHRRLTELVVVERGQLVKEMRCVGRAELPALFIRHPAGQGGLDILAHAGDSATPLLMLHGGRDTRVHPSQALELYRHHGPTGTLARPRPSGSMALWMAVLLLGFLVFSFF